MSNLRISPQTGRVGDQEFDANRWGKPATMEHVQRGDTSIVQGHGGESVAQLQQRLAQLGYLPGDSVDGRFGPQTRDALKKFQERNELKQDGMFGKDSYDRLFGKAARPAVDGASRGSDAGREHVREFAARNDFGQMVKADPWREELTADAAHRADRARAGRERIEALEGSLNSLPPDQQASAKETIGELKKLYEKLEGRYFWTDQNGDANKAKALEEKLARQMPGRS